jgi:CubicO group peptidase (beta-lactamase class C family)
MLRRFLSMLTLAVCLLLLPACKVGRFFWYNFSNITDYRIFPKRDLPASTQPFRFVDAQQNDLLGRTVQVKDHTGESRPLNEFLAQSPTVAFLVIRNDSLLYENYFEGYSESSTVASFSMAKSYVSALIGIAIGEGKIGSEDDSVTRYLPELKGRDNWDRVTLHHLLQMSSGVKFSEGYYSPFSGAASYYYGRRLRESIRHLHTEQEPMSGFDYKSVNTQLLAVVLERATGRSVTDYLNEKIWQPIGMEYEASWSIDKRDGIEKAFCCINAKARDFAKFGRLYLNKGDWNGRQLVPASWVEKSVVPVNEKGAATYYNRQWWIGGKADGDYAAIGHLGQYIYVLPKKNLVIVRLGRSRGKDEYLNIIRQVAAQF